MRILCKEGVWFKELNKSLMDFSGVLDRLWSDFGHGDPTITSAADGKHSLNSYHPLGYAWDIRIWGMSATEAETAASALRNQLRGINPAYDVVYGDEKHKDHIHVEFDLKRAGTLEG